MDYRTIQGVDGEIRLDKVILGGFELRSKYFKRTVLSNDGQIL